MIQVHPNNRLRKLLTAQLNKVTEVEPKRGDIYDSNLDELAVTRLLDSFSIDPRLFSPDQQQIRRLAELLQMKEEDLLALSKRESNFVWLRRKVMPELAYKIRALHLRGVFAQKEEKRVYPNGRLAAQLLGFVNYRNNGVYGVEKLFDSKLKGSRLSYTITRDAIGRSLYGEKALLQRTFLGKDVVLSIDKNVQFICEEELERAIVENEAEKGFIIAMNPRNGALLAVAQYPSFDPNEYGKYSRNTWRSMPFTDPFEPGSTAKIFTLTTALAEKGVKSDDLIYCEDGKMRLVNRIIHDAHPFKWLRVDEILKYSSNIGAVKIGEKIPRHNIADWLSTFGFGEISEIRFPGESAGQLKSAKKWDKVTSATMTFGQGISVTGIQLISAFSAVINGGYRIQPTLLKINDDPMFLGPRIISAAIADAMKRMLVKVVEPGGTGTKAKVEGYVVGGKTGTSQKFDKEANTYSANRHYASFIGFAPFDDPKLSLLVVIDEPKRSYYGSTVAAPAFSKTVKRILNYIQIPSEGSTTIVLTKPSENSRVGKTTTIQPDILPDLHGKTLREVLRILPGVDIKPSGRGFVIRQFPEPGTPTKRTLRLKIQLNNSLGPDDDRIGSI